MCIRDSPYSAITNFKRPCERACKVDAIHMAKDGVATIDSEKCISCGACVYQCPFGATLDVSSITDVIKTIMASENNEKFKVYAVVALSLIHICYLGMLLRSRMQLRKHMGMGKSEYHSDARCHCCRHRHLRYIRIQAQ